MPTSKKPLVYICSFFLAVTFSLQCSDPYFSLCLYTHVVVSAFCIFIVILVFHFFPFLSVISFSFCIFTIIFLCLLYFLSRFFFCLYLIFIPFFIYFIIHFLFYILILFHYSFSPLSSLISISMLFSSPSIFSLPFQFLFSSIFPVVLLLHHFPSDLVSLFFTYFLFYLPLFFYSFFFLSSIFSLFFLFSPVLFYFQVKTP